MVSELLAPTVRRLATDPAKLPVGSVLVHPDHDPTKPDACRLVRVAVTHGEWAWRRLTGLPSGVPDRGADLVGWTVQPLGDLAMALRHAAGLSGHEVGR